ncbi:HAMP domain-containing protein [Rhodocyclus tenuis]|uniref:histidine kinase n=1 Tax=Rhodocyclus tenuis TaxID=1066 RepID=A0A6L5JXC1_RHOTE|nr:sensor histidine kinase [Rhodocyclus gracilis]MQY51681.1 HAMP domain-containing protein [Rhodocyclus gracilis]MRD73162.1 HAMP domain-containing protein [Rhodocyclus gracilis]
MRQTPSLRRQLALRLLPAVLLLILAGAYTAYNVARDSALLAYDRALLDTTLAISGQIHVERGEVHLTLPRGAEEILFVDKYDKISFRVLTTDGQQIAGTPHLPPPSAPPEEENRVYYDATLDGQPVRVAALFIEREGIPLTVLVAETLVKRNNLTWEVVLGMLLPELGLVFATLALVWLGIGSGLRPLDDLRKQLARRSPSDLRPLDTGRSSEEIAAVVAELNHLLLRLDQSLTAQRHFVSDAAHQLRTPIAALQAQMELALRSDAATLAAPLQGTVSAVQRLAHLVQQLLALARAEPAGQANEEIVDLAAAVHRVAETMLPTAFAADIDLGFSLQAARVKGSPLLIEEAIANLIDNALRYTPRHGTVNVSLIADDNGTALRVEDSGPGIPANAREQVFERFFRLPESGGDGCGLGLAIVRRIAGQHGATVRIDDSAELGGALIELRFPAACQG